VLKQHKGKLDFINSLPLEDARNHLITFPGVGPKTADVVLLLSSNKSVFPVDTHINRVTKRLGFVELNANYEKIRASLEFLFDPEEYLSAHLMFIALGRKYCKARNPLHKICPIKKHCPRIMKDGK
jgi:endonuclease-3